MGVDNDEMICNLSDPPLSSIEPGARRLGYQAAALLDQLMQGQGAATAVRRGSRGSCCPPLHRHPGHEQPGGGPGRAPDPGTGLRGDQDQRRNQSRPLVAIDHRAKVQGGDGRTMHAEIDRLRLDRARELLVKTELPLKQVAAQAGFKYIQYMTTLFRQRLQQTPRQYRLRRGPAR